MKHNETVVVTSGTDVSADDWYSPLTSAAPLERILQILYLLQEPSHIEREIRLIEAEAEANRACWERCRKRS